MKYMIPGANSTSLGIGGSTTTRIVSVTDHFVEHDYGVRTVTAAADFNFFEPSGTFGPALVSKFKVGASVGDIDEVPVATIVSIDGGWIELEYLNGNKRTVRSLPAGANILL